MASPYTIEYTDPSDKASFTILPGGTNGPTGILRTLDIELVGMGTAIWGEKIEENLVHMLENFSCPESAPGVPDSAFTYAPITPTRGQLWFNSTQQKLFIWEGTEWQMFMSRNTDGDLDMEGFKIINLEQPAAPTGPNTPVDPDQAATTQYVHDIFIDAEGDTISGDLTFAFDTPNTETFSTIYAGTVGQSEIYVKELVAGTKELRISYGDGTNANEKLEIGTLNGAVWTRQATVDNVGLDIAGDSHTVGNITTDEYITLENNRYLRGTNSTSEITRMIGIDSGNAMQIGGIDNLASDITGINFFIGASSYLQINPTGDILSGGSVSDNDVFVRRGGADVPLATEDFVTVSAPTGTVASFADDVAPSGWFICDGTSLDTTTYNALFAVISYTFGGATSNFNIPDLRGEFIRGWAGAGGVDAGRGFGTNQANEIQSHTHLNIRKGISENADNGGGQGEYLNHSYGVRDSSTSATGGTETRPRNVALNYIIKY